VQLTIDNVSKRYGGGNWALRNFSLQLVPGVLGLLGPNGAGKTTFVRVLTTLLRPDAGTARVVGLDVVEDAAELRERIGLAGQYAAVDENLTGLENLTMVGRLYGENRKRAKARGRELLARFDLSDAAKRPAKTYSGGMRRRLDLAAALVAKPPVLFLDEPTTGLDPRSRLAMWSVLESLVSEGTTVLLTTQYLDEADRLADMIAVVDHGLVIAQGTSDELKARTGGERVEVVVHEREHIRTAAEVLGGFGKGDTTVEEHTRRLTVPVTGGAKLLAEVIRELDSRGIEIDDIALRRPTLDDVAPGPGLELGGRSGRDHAPVVDDYHVGRELVGLVEVLRREQHVGPALDERADRLPELVAAARVESGGRLVEEQHARHRDEAGGEVEPAAHAARQVLREPVGGIEEVELVEQGGGAPPPFGPAQVVQVRHQQQVLLAGEQVVDRGELAGDPDRGPYRGRVPGHVMACDAHLAAVGVHQRGHDLHGGGLAGAVGTEQRERRSRWHLQVDAV